MVRGNDLIMRRHPSLGFVGVNFSEDDFSFHRAQRPGLPDFLRRQSKTGDEITFVIRIFEAMMLL
jgi:hypothetical protein